MERNMSEGKWVSIKSQHCHFLDREVEQLELRVYAPEVIGEAEPYRVIARKCSDSLECNLAEYPCKWAFTNPVMDQFKIDEK